LLQWYEEIVGAVERVAVGEPVGAAAVDAFENLGGELARAALHSESVLRSASKVLTRDELISNAAVFLFGGIETSEGMTANAMFHLLANVDQLALMRADRGLVDAAVEESLRLEPAAARVDRYATSAIELAGAHIAAGDLVVVSLTAANRDPVVFDRPDRFDVRRPNARSHVAFAQGPHACIGAQLARMETRAAITAVLDLLPDIELVSVEPPSGAVFRKPHALHARWTIT
jgi:cytochrome P450